MYFPMNFLKLFETVFLKEHLWTAASILGKNLKNFTINYDLAKYLTTLTITIDFAENIWNSDVARGRSKNPIQSMIQHFFGFFFLNKFPEMGRITRRVLVSLGWAQGLSVPRILFENKVILQLTSKNLSQALGNVLEFDQFYRFLLHRNVDQFIFIFLNAYFLTHTVTV